MKEGFILGLMGLLGGVKVPGGEDHDLRLTILKGLCQQNLHKFVQILRAKSLKTDYLTLTLRDFARIFCSN